MQQRGKCAIFRQIVIGAAAVLGLASTAKATVEISTTARGLVSNVRVVGQPLTLIEPVAAVTGRTAPGYNLSNSAALLAATVGLGSTRVLITNAIGISSTN